MSFAIDPGVKYHPKLGDYENRKNCYCFFHAVQRIIKGERIESEVYDNNDEYDSPGVCPDCLTEETGR